MSERPDLVGLPLGVVRDIERDYRPAFAALGLDFNARVNATAVAAEVNWIHKRVGRTWGASASYTEKRGWLRSTFQTRSLAEADADLRSQLDRLLVNKPWEKP